MATLVAGEFAGSATFAAIAATPVGAGTVAVVGAATAAGVVGVGVGLTSSRTTLSLGDSVGVDNQKPQLNAPIALILRPA